MRTPFIVSELSCNHLGSFERAAQIVEAAAHAGADGIKFQVWEQDTMCIDPAYTLNHGPWAGRTLVDLYREAYTPWEWLPQLFGYARDLGLIPFASPFDKASVDFLETLRCPIYKIASFELVDLGLIEYAASKGKSVFMATGMANDKDIERAVWAARAARDITLLKCTSAYPADPETANLPAMLTNAKRYNVFPGLSDHSPGIGVAVAAAALGAKVIEKHLTLSRGDGGPDAGFSMEPDEFARMVMECRRAAAAVQPMHSGPVMGESPALRRSLWFKRDVAAGQIITEDDVCTARPALGLSPHQIGEVLGKRASVSVCANSPVTQVALQ
jgi:N-acetylneuraminate synthase